MKYSYMYMYTRMIFATVLSPAIKIFHRHLGPNLLIFAVILWHITAKKHRPRWFLAKTRCACCSWIYNYLCNKYLSPLTLWVRFHTHDDVYSIQHHEISLSETCGRSVSFSGYSSFLHQLNWLLRHNWNIVESGVKYHRHIHISKGPICIENLKFYPLTAVWMKKGLV